MILVGQYDSPYVRRALPCRCACWASSTRPLSTRSVFAGIFEAMRKVNPLGRIPSLVLDSGETLIDSAAILDWLDEEVGPERALLPRSGAGSAARLAPDCARHRRHRQGGCGHLRADDPPGGPPLARLRCRTQAAGAIEALGAEPWPEGAPLDQAQITAACMIRYVRMADPELLPAGRYPALDALSERAEARREFRATYPADYALPRAD